MWKILQKISTLFAPSSGRLCEGEIFAKVRSKLYCRGSARPRGPGVRIIASTRVTTPRGPRRRRGGKPRPGPSPSYLGVVAADSQMISNDPSVPQPVVQSRRRPLLGPSPGWKRLLALSHLRHYVKRLSLLWPSSRGLLCDCEIANLRWKL